MFQAVFSWAALPMDAINAVVEATGAMVTALLPPGILQSLLVDGVIAGTGGVLVFLPQILILFLFILALEDSGYLPRAAFLLDRMMGTVGLSGRSFIPLLSSFACAVPGIMAARHITSWRDRLTTIMIAPLMTCSARLPVYALIIAAFIPRRTILGVFNLQGLVLFVLYLAGIVGAMAVAWVLKVAAGRGTLHPLLMKLPSYRRPSLRNLAIGLVERARIFLTRVGTIILSLSILLWFLASFPAPPPGAPAGCEFFVRPEALRLVEARDAPLRGEVSRCIFLGDRTRVTVVGAAAIPLTVDSSGTLPPAVGDGVGLDAEAGALMPVLPGADNGAPS